MNSSSEQRLAVFIDRDGTLIEDMDYLADPAEMRIYNYSAEALRLLKDEGYLLIVLTNQSGVARGLMTEANVAAVHEALDKELPGLIDAFYYCPHGPADGCRCRKPGTGMVEQALEDLPIDIVNSWIVGDKDIDVQTGFNAGMATALVLTGYGQSHIRTMERMPDIVADDLLAASKEIAKRTDQ
jgi:D-glycero-D-manno-heptose 1,7-bisphosphate phosphatase